MLVYIFFQYVLIHYVHSFDQKYSKKQLYCEILYYYYKLKECFFYLIFFFNVIYSCDVRPHYSNLQCHMILQKSFLIIIDVENIA